MASERSFKVENHSATVLSQMNRQRKENQLCDVELQVGRKKFPAHRSLLAASSEFFFTMFTTNMKERHERTVKIGEVNEKAMESILNFLYTEDITLTEENVTDILCAASRMRIMDLVEVVISYLSDVLDTGNCLFFRNLGRLHSLDRLVAEADEYVLKHFEDVCKQPAFYELDQSYIERLLESDDLKVKLEATVFEAIVQWVDKDEQNRKQYFPQLFKHIRLQYVPTKYVADKIRKHKLVREFHDCRDLVEDAFYFLISPETFVAQKPRKGLIPEPDSIMLFQQSGIMQFIHEPHKRQQWIDVSKNNMTANSVKPYCGVAMDYRGTTFCGGLFNNTQMTSNEVIQFDGTQWKSLPAMNVARSGPATVCVDGALFAFGGEKKYRHVANVRQDIRNTYFADDWEMYDGSWKVKGKLQNLRSEASAVNIQGRIYLIGGYTFHNAPGFVTACSKQASKTVDIYDTESDAWEIGPQMKYARASFGAAALKGKIYVIGGLQTGGSCVTGVEILDTESRTWSTVNCNVNSSLGTTSACSVQGKIYAFGSNNTLLQLDPNGSNSWEVSFNHNLGIFGRIVGVASSQKKVV